MANVPGRACPPSYRYADGELKRAPDLYVETMYVVGGLYGNEQALDNVIALHAAEPESVLVFNGDFNWFNVAAESFLRINRCVLAHIALRGNVETELASDDASAGCGCGYPAWVGDVEVARSNAIMARLRATASSAPQLRARLGQLPMSLIAEIGDARVAVVHGDLESLAGWGGVSCQLAGRQRSSCLVLGPHPERYFLCTRRSATAHGRNAARRFPSLKVSSGSCVPTEMHCASDPGGPFLTPPPQSL
jgi:hypothetical protein